MFIAELIGHKVLLALTNTGQNTITTGLELNIYRKSTTFLLIARLTDLFVLDLWRVLTKLAAYSECFHFCNNNVLLTVPVFFFQLITTPNSQPLLCSISFPTNFLRVVSFRLGTNLALVYHPFSRFHIVLERRALDMPELEWQLHSMVSLFLCFCFLSCKRRRVVVRIQWVNI